MTKVEVVRKAMMDALKAGDKPRKEALSLLLSALKAKTIDKREDLTEDEANAVVYREIKEAQETLDTAPVDVWIRRVIDEDYGGRSPFPAYGEHAGIFQQYLFYGRIAQKG